MPKPCFKREVCAVIVDVDGKIAIGENLIYNEEVKECPRLKGEGYEKCETICNQKGHAEIMAIEDAKKRGLKLEDATLYLMGHHRMCAECIKECRDHGLSTFMIMGDE